MKRKKQIAYIVSFIALLSIFLYVFKNYENLKTISQISYNYLTISLISLILNLYINAVIIKKILIPFNINLKEPLALSSASSLLNYSIPMRGGAAFRAIFLKKIYKLNYKKFISTLLGFYIITFLSSSIIGLILVLISYITTKTYSLTLIASLSIILLSTILFIKIDPKLKSQNKIIVIIANILSGWKKISKNKKLVLSIFILNSISIIVLSITNYCVFLGIGYKDINFLASIQYSILNIFSSLINITPGSLGITEILYILSGHTLNISTNISLLASLMFRSLAFISFIILGLPSYIYLLKILKNTKEKQI